MQLLQQAGLPTKIPSYIDTRELINKLYTDKKVLKGKIRFVFQEGIGKMKCFSDGNYSLELDENYIFDTLVEIRGGYHG